MRTEIDHLILFINIDRGDPDSAGYITDDHLQAIAEDLDPESTGEVTADEWIVTFVNNDPDRPVVRVPLWLDVSDFASLKGIAREAQAEVDRAVTKVLAG